MLQNKSVDFIRYEKDMAALATDLPITDRLGLECCITWDVPREECFWDVFLSDVVSQRTWDAAYKPILQHLGN